VLPALMFSEVICAFQLGGARRVQPHSGSVKLEIRNVLATVLVGESLPPCARSRQARARERGEAGT